jgi:hypothetical protein
MEMRENERMYFNKILEKYSIDIDNYYYLDRDDSQEDDLNKLSLIINFYYLDREKYREFITYLSKNFDIKINKLDKYIILLSIKYDKINI